jgi:NitT/TauT family transport system permease protein
VTTAKRDAPTAAPASPVAGRAGRSRHPRRRRWAGTIGPAAASLAVFVLVWQLIVFVSGFKPFILPGPLSVAQAFVRAWTDGTMLPNVAATLTEVLLGFALGASVALAVGIALARSRLAERLLSPYLVAAQATPVLALAPLIALWFGAGLLPKLVITTLIVFFPVAVATMVGIRSVDPRLLEMARSFRASPWQTITRVEVPAAAPVILGAMRVGVTLAVVGAVVGEWTSPDQGIGVLINIARASLFDTPLMFAALLQLAIIGVALYLVMLLIERRIVGER